MSERLSYGRHLVGGGSGGGSGSGGHTVITPDGTMPQRGNMHFTDAHGTDNSANNETEITVFKHISQADFDNLTPTQQNTGGYIIDDANPSYIPANNCVSVTADGVKSHATLLDELLSLIDESKIGRNSVLVYAPPNGNVNYCHIDRDTTSNGISFSNTIIGLNNNNVVDYYFILNSGGCKYKERVNGSVTDNSTNAPTSGAKYTLYYNIVASPVVEESIYKTYDLSDSMYFGVTSHSGMWYIFYIPMQGIKSTDVVTISLSNVTIYLNGSTYSVSDLNLSDTEIRIGDIGIRIDLKFTSAKAIDAQATMRINSSGGSLTIAKA